MVSGQTLLRTVNFWRLGLEDFIVVIFTEGLLYRSGMNNLQFMFVFPPVRLQAMDFTLLPNLDVNVCFIWLRGGGLLRSVWLG